MVALLKSNSLFNQAHIQITSWQKEAVWLQHYLIVSCSVWNWASLSCQFVLHLVQLTILNVCSSVSTKNLSLSTSYTLLFVVNGAMCFKPIRNTRVYPYCFYDKYSWVLLHPLFKYIGHGLLCSLLTIKNLSNFKLLQSATQL